MTFEDLSKTFDSFGYRSQQANRTCQPTNIPVADSLANSPSTCKRTSIRPRLVVLRGLKPDNYAIDENIIIYAGVSSYIGSVRGRQDSKLLDGGKQSSMLNHIKDLSQTAVAGNIGAPAYTTDKQVFHTDAGDIVSLFSLNVAAKDGESKLASSWRVYNELAETRPDIIKTLLKIGCLMGE